MFYSGTQGQMFIDGVKAAKVRSWTMNSSLSLLDTTTLGDTDGNVYTRYPHQHGKLHDLLLRTSGRPDNRELLQHFDQQAAKTADRRK